MMMMMMMMMMVMMKTRTMMIRTEKREPLERKESGDDAREPDDQELTNWLDSQSSPSYRPVP